MDWQAGRAHQLSMPSPEGLVAMARAVDSRARPLRVTRMGGGLASATHAVDLRTANGTIIRTVVKRYRPADATGPLEWERLTFAAGLDVPTPEPLALDASGDWFGAPALVMRRLDGRAHHTPSDPDAWLRQMASALVAIASGTRRGAPAAMRRPFRWRPPRGLRLTALTEPAIDAVCRELPKVANTGRVVSHGDFHPGNLLWLRGRLSGVVDWSHARLAPRAFDVAYCRADLCVLVGPGAADRLRHHYERIWGGRVEDLPVFDLACGLAALRWSHLWVVTYGEQGRTDLTIPRVKGRAAALVRRSLAELRPD
jgi:aminoglycoside phosphotransferase (APT) family kinase protein